jgi:hypothetical protein
MSLENKYIKYKNKYLNLCKKNIMLGGSAAVNPKEWEKCTYESLGPNGQLFKNVPLDTYINTIRNMVVDWETYETFKNEIIKDLEKKAPKNPKHLRVFETGDDNQEKYATRIHKATKEDIMVKAPEFIINGITGINNNKDLQDIFRSLQEGDYYVTIGLYGESKINDIIIL